MAYVPVGIGQEQIDAFHWRYARVDVDYGICDRHGRVPWEAAKAIRCWDGVPERAHTYHRMPSAVRLRYAQRACEAW